MPFNTNITVGRPPLLWSDVHDAFTKINENFDILVATIGSGSGLTPIDFTSLDTSVNPTLDNTYTLGDSLKTWKSIRSSAWGPEFSNALNGLWAGNAQLKGVGSTINLPANSTIGGDPATGIGVSLIVDPDKTFFKTIDVDNNNSIVATGFGDTVKFLSGSGVSMNVDSSAESITFNNTGILSIADGSGISHTTVSGVSTITNTGVRSLQSTVGLPSGRTTGAGINISGSTGDNLRVTNTGVISISSGVGITVSLDSATGNVTVTNSAPAGNTFAQVEINGDSINRLIADAASDVLYINSGEGITITKSSATDTLTLSVNPVFDLKGSVFGDDSSILVDAVSNYIYGNVRATTLRTNESTISLGYEAGLTSQTTYAIAIGDGAGKTTQGDSSVAIGLLAGQTSQGNFAVALGINAAVTNQGSSAIAIGSTAGNSGQGANAIAIGSGAGYLNQSANSIILNASGSPFNGAASGFYVNPIRSTSSATAPLMYNSTTKELFYSPTLEFIGSTISTNDSSGITVDVQTTFNTDVRVENDLTVLQGITLQGSRVLNLADIKSIVAASSSFADFQTKIAALV